MEDQDNTSHAQTTQIEEIEGNDNQFGRANTRAPTDTEYYGDALQNKENHYDCAIPNDYKPNANVILYYRKTTHSDSLSMSTMLMVILINTQEMKSERER